MTKPKRPCARCPFRTDITPYLRHARVQEIAESLERGAMFPCHETVDYAGDGEPVVGQRARWCAGAVIVMLKSDILDYNQHARICMRLGTLNPDAMDLSAPVPDDLDGWVDLHAELESKRRPKRKA